ncbi:aequorin-1-like [Actinia tenebrosa]|uniref:Aequorin-1-like n=1 Tax=Actinia tenebrosa TaxID=6105 RepID=A0A1D7XF10_ACTTE|nr:aequorin-1-like [Actinia tenebrosa]AOQ25780.1 photoprotein-like protein [Actinia tenebrosa]
MTTEIDLTRNPIWVKRVEGLFDTMDVNGNGLLSISEILKWADNLEKACKATPKEIKSLREALQMMWGVVGLVPGVELDKKQFVKGFNRLAKGELKRHAEHKTTLHNRQNNAFFDVIDVNNDGTVSLDEVKTMMKACNYDEDAAEAWFNAADTNRDGRIDRNELNKVEFEYWFSNPQPSNKGLFGGVFE